LGKKPLEFITIGQLLKETATKHPDKVALISCMENKRLTFAETLHRVRMKKTESGEAN
jgi:acyl-CoA synthetase (AMP-forming)/AMP-acid ligase II